ncbi:universal stress protein [Halostagnicola sp. A-GB9-2]|uniref:universal stress protein n=1 Tax=Halostagnicola sp. A-GB9-2 TaxID=3048066 RepID=UPI0024BFB98D|nr:universal stress protein [Halostagnicola sp. A-GB9-2]MDJ1431579.1 universal stress protein [Halostagnicola sp. A-GB9-2]
MYRVLVPIDDRDDRVRSQAEAVLELPDADSAIRVDVLHVETDIEIFDGDGEEPEIGELKEDRDSLEELPETAPLIRDLLAEAGVETAFHTIAGNTTSGILNVADQFDSDTLVLGARRRTPAGKAIFGSVSQKIILNSDRPVMVVPN